jgi:hypothetical protein
MKTLPELYPKVQDLLGLAPEHVAVILLRFGLTAEKNQNGIFQPDYVNQLALGNEHLHSAQPRYTPLEVRKAEDLLGEAWLFIDREGFVMPAPGINGANGFKKFTAKGRGAAAGFDPESYRQAAFPKELLHPKIVAEAWNDYIGTHSNHLQKAVFNSFLAVEDAVRSAAKLPKHLSGVDLVRNAFNDANGALTNLADPIGERQALAHLFAGAYGVFRNPAGHGYTGLSDLRDAQYQLLLASMLLSIVDARR